MEILQEDYNRLIKTTKDNLNLNNIDFFFGAELEFYVLGQDRQIEINSDYFNKMKNFLFKKAEARYVKILKLDKEDGFNQFEIQFDKTSHPVLSVYYINETKSILSNFDSNISFLAKPIKNEPGSSIHIHISLFSNNINLYDKNQATKKYNDVFYWSVYGLIELMPYSIYLLANSENCYERFIYPEENQKYKHYPTNYSWGFNNRTCAIRIPSSLSGSYPISRIEHRVSSSSVNPKVILSIICQSLEFGIRAKKMPPDPVFGDAFSFENDHIKEFPFNLKKAKELFEDGKFFNDLLTSQ